MKLRIKEQILSFKKPLIMGILNVTPDSFSDGGRYCNPDRACEHAEEMILQGADIIDIGGQSTRPGSQPVTLQEELSRVLPVVKKISAASKTLISVDTYYPGVMKLAVEAGAHIINDINALQTEGALKTAAELNVPVILMHKKGIPSDMQKNPEYDNVLSEITDFFKERIQRAAEAGIREDQIILDPGFGFGKNFRHNYQLLKNLNKLTELGYPVLSALSRKTMIGEANSISSPQDRVIGSVSGALISVMKGASIVRVHDVSQTRQALEIYNAMNSADLQDAL